MSYEQPTVQGKSINGKFHNEFNNNKQKRSIQCKKKVSLDVLSINHI